MVALAGAFGVFHLAQQGVHFRQAELATGADGAVAGHGGEKFVTLAGGDLADAVFAQIGDQGAGEGDRVAGLQQGGNGAHAELVGAKRCNGETQGFERAAMLFDGGDVKRVGGEHGGNQQRLRGDGLLVEGSLQLFVKDAFVGGVHVDDDQAAGILRQDVDAVQLGQGVAEWRRIAVDRRFRAKLRGVLGAAA